MNAHPTRPARAERYALADLLIEVGPDAPTLCEGWSTRDLAAHLIVRERRPDAAAGTMLRPLRGHGERVRSRYTALPYPELVELVRRPPKWSMSGLAFLDALTNTVEYFVHHEDVRRAQPQWTARTLTPQLDAALWSQLRRSAPLLLRRMPASIVLAAGGNGEIRAGRGGPLVRVEGPPGELTLFTFGRQRAALVDLTGPDDVVEQLRQARLGI